MLSFGNGSSDRKHYQKTWRWHEDFKKPIYKLLRAMSDSDVFLFYDGFNFYRCRRNTTINTWGFAKIGSYEKTIYVDELSHDDLISRNLYVNEELYDFYKYKFVNSGKTNKFTASVGDGFFSGRVDTTLKFNRIYELIYLGKFTKEKYAEIKEKLPLRKGFYLKNKLSERLDYYKRNKYEFERFKRRN